jgi:hypothetical protein
MINIACWLIISLLTAYTARALRYSNKKSSLGQLVLNSFIWAFIVATLSHLVLGLGSVTKFSLISTNLSWSGALLGVYLVSKGHSLKVPSNKIFNKGYQIINSALNT